MLETDGSNFKQMAATYDNDDYDIDEDEDLIMVPAEFVKAAEMQGPLNALAGPLEILDEHPLGFKLG